MNITAQQLVMAMLNNNPDLKNNQVVQQAINLAQAGNTGALNIMLENICKERGINIDDLSNRLKQRINRN